MLEVWRPVAGTAVAVAAPLQCREPIAENVSDKQRANFCGYIQINPQAYAGPSDQAADSHRQLDAMFGDGASEEASEASSSEDELSKQLGQLFKK
jgi:hypothetical protein